MAGKIVKKSGAAATARTPIVRKAVKGTPGYMQPTLASKAKAMRRSLVQEENPGWFDVMHRVAAWVVSLEPCFEATEEDFLYCHTFENASEEIIVTDCNRPFANRCTKR
ncbi:hypothetical protein BDZ91DRAFT_801123 [Kalaharituber pfeilii]|nr:hypothetical protein BDZ91DRAFT_801123 [Kalaharituber pfeilii]